jgi:prepilin-type N-terminal cleavage/methylation domain-containing protein
MLRTMKGIKGFTLVELMISVGISLGLLAAVYMAVNSAQHHSSAIESKVTAQEDIKPTLDLMAMEIGMASYNATFTADLWVNPTGACIAASANQSYRGIQEATANSIVVEMDIRGTTDGNGEVIGDGMLGDENEVIRYNYDRANRYITRETNCGGGQPFLGDTAASGRPRTVRVINETLGLPLFRYYNGTGACILEAAENPTGNCVDNVDATRLPAGIPNIRRIDITLAVETENVDPNTNLRRRLIYSTSVIPRNHAISQ